MPWYPRSSTQGYQGSHEANGQDYLEAKDPEINQELVGRRRDGGTKAQSAFFCQVGLGNSQMDGIETLDESKDSQLVYSAKYQADEDSIGQVIGFYERHED